LCFCICERDALVFLVVGLACLALVTFFRRAKVGRDQAVGEVGVAQEGGSVLVALCDPVFSIGAVACQCSREFNHTFLLLFMD